MGERKIILIFALEVALVKTSKHADNAMELKNDNTLVNKFDLYLQRIKGIGDGARGNYLSWTRYLMKTHDLAAIHNEADVEKILNIEEMMMASPKREVYKTKCDLINFHSTLMKNFLPFIRSYREALEKERSTVTVDRLIDMVGEQGSPTDADSISHTISIIAISSNYILSDAQKSRLRANLVKVGSKIPVDKMFLPGSHYHSAH